MRACTHGGQWGTPTTSQHNIMTRKNSYKFVLCSGRDSNLWSWSLLYLEADALPIEPPRPPNVSLLTVFAASRSCCDFMSPWYDLHGFDWALKTNYRYIYLSANSCYIVLGLRLGRCLFTAYMIMWYRSSDWLSGAPPPPPPARSLI